jgi:RNA polymerase sigma-70 factor (ECF subfamily)
VSTSAEEDSRNTAREVAEDVARRSYGKLVALLASRHRDITGAEDALAEAFATALSDWATQGVPANPEGWLMAVARRKWIDASRRQKTALGAADHLRLIFEERAETDTQDEERADPRLALMFACAHPAIDAGIRAPLILQTILGFDAVAIGSAFLVSPRTMGQRLVRAKRKIRDAGIPFHRPEGPELAERLGAVLEAIYGAYAEGWADPSGTDTRRRDLAEEAIWLGRLVVSLMPEEAEALGLLALMLHAQARRGARHDASGEYVPLADQEPALWDKDLLEEADGLLAQASRLPGDTGRYQLEAAVQSAHAVRRLTGSADWRAIAAIYGALLERTGSPVVAVNRAVALAEVDGALVGLAALEVVAGDARLDTYQPYWAARAELLARAGEVEAARDAYERAIGLESDASIRRFLDRRRDALSAPRAT